MSESSSIFYPYTHIDTPSYVNRPSKDRFSTSSKVGAIAIAVIAGGLTALLVAHFGLGFPLNSLNTIGMSVGGAGLGGVIVFSIFKILNTYFKNQESRYSLSPNEVNFTEDESDPDIATEYIVDYSEHSTVNRSDFKYNKNSEETDIDETDSKYEDSYQSNYGEVEVYYRNGQEIYGHFGDEIC